MVDPHNLFAADKAPIVPYESVVQVLVKRDFSETFYRLQFNGEKVGKCEFNNCITHL